MTGRLTRRVRWQIAWANAILIAVAPAAFSQQNSPHIGYIYPAGGQQGATVQVLIGGQYLNGATNAFISGTGVEVIVPEHEPPLTPKQATELRDRVQELRKQPKDAATLREIAAIRKKLAAFQKARTNPAIAETVPVQITVAANAAPGARELRLVGERGLSNPFSFHVGQFPEFTQPEAEDDEPRFQAGPRSAAPTPDLNVALPAVVNGQILPGATQRFRFKARQGDRLIVAASARQLIPYLADAVPGWFQAVVTLSDAEGHELQYADHYRFQPDPILYCEIPRDGEYVVAIRDALYRGREDFIYRITVGELPFITSIFPLGVQAGTKRTVEVRGCNLPTSTLVLDARQLAPGTHPISVRSGEWISNHVPFAVDSLPECMEKEPNDAPKTAQPITLPIIVNGRIDRPGDWDVFRFTGQAHQEIVAEVQARRLDSPLDSVLKLTDADGKQLAFNDDYEDKGSGLETHHADSYLRATLPADGTYYLHIGDTQHEGGPLYAYRLRISEPRPDFALRVVPSSLNARVGGTVPVTVHALRRDGFTNDIALALKDAPQGFRLSGGPISGTQEIARLSLSVPSARTEPFDLALEGRSTIDGKEVVRPCVPAEDMMQAFAYRHLVPSKELKVAVVDRFVPRPVAKILGETPVKIPAGGTVRVQMASTGGIFPGKIQLELIDPPEGILIQSVAPSREGMEIVLQSDATKTLAGLKGSLIVKAFAEKPRPADDGKPDGAKQRTPVGPWPSIPFVIVPP